MKRTERYRKAREYLERVQKADNRAEKLEMRLENLRILATDTANHLNGVTPGGKADGDRIGRITAEIADDLCGTMPELKGHLTPAAAGTPLTCRDYDPPTGSAYGVRNVCAQSRLFGRLPVRNFFIPGQSSLVPGVMGAMLSSFTVFRMAVGAEIYCKIIRDSGIC